MIECVRPKQFRSLRCFPYAALRVVLLAALFAVSSQLAGADVFVVNSTGDDPDAAADAFCDTGNLIPDGAGGFLAECTLRAAIDQADRNSDRDQIVFSNTLLFTSNMAYINLTSALQPIDFPVDIDGTTAPGWTAGTMPRVLLRGAGTAGFSGLVFASGADESTVFALGFQDFLYGVVLDGADEAWIDSCAFGFHVTPLPGIESLRPNVNGIRVEAGSSESQLGMRAESTGPPLNDVTFVGNGNVISANTWGIVNHGGGTRILGNKIGTNYPGDRITTRTIIPPEDLGNNYGLWLTNLDGVRVGEVIEPAFAVPRAAGNVISGNEYGIYIGEPGSTPGEPLSVVGNKIGTDVEGQLDLGNEFYGIGIITAATPIKIGELIAGGNVISGNGTNGIEIDYAALADIEIRRNQIGVGADTVTPLGNGGSGIAAQAGDPLLIEDNTIGHSGEDAIRIAGPWFAPIGAVDIRENWIGTNAAGDTLPNSGAGVLVNHFADPSVDIMDNVIGASEYGLLLGEEASFVSVRLNKIGTNDDGANLGNNLAGIRSDSIEGGHTIGGLGTGNVIGFNGTNGISIQNATEISTIQGNFIGVTPEGEARPNARNGVRVRVGGPERVIVGFPPGTTPEYFDVLGNSIAFNPASGVSLQTDATAELRGNKFEENAVQAIDLNEDGATANDLANLDADLGANQLQNFPVIDGPDTYYDIPLGELEIEYNVSSATTESDYDLTIDFYVADGTGFQPLRHIGEDVYSAALAAGQRTIRFAPTGGFLPTDLILATATDASGHTSEVSPPILVPEPGLRAGLLLGSLALGLRGRRSRVRRTSPIA